jgi:purine-nucleoside phosphorylase
LGKALKETLSMDKKQSEAVQAIRDHVEIEANIGVILGSGLGNLVEHFEERVSIKYEDIPNFPVSSVMGHKGELVAGRFSGVPLFACSGRVHYYEGYTIQEICFPVQVLAGLGVEKLIITNAAGAINESYAPGDIVAIEDHINLMGDNPLRGTSNFIDMTNAYDRDLRSLAHSVADELGMGLNDGVYLVLSGPSFETPAEIRMMRSLGADMVGMSTIPEVIMANSLDVRVLGLSMMTNMAAGITGERLTHEEVFETTQRAAEKFKILVGGIIEKMVSGER